jgi:hypothetical protein
MFNLAYNCSNCGYCWEHLGEDIHEGNRCPHCNSYECPYTHWSEYYDEENMGNEEE